MQPEELYEVDAEAVPDLEGAALLVYLEGMACPRRPRAG